MKKYLSISYTSGQFNFTMLLIRVIFGLLMILDYGLPKLMQFATLSETFYSFLGLGSQASLVLAIFAEIFCSLFLIIGLFTRITVIPLLITMLVAIFGFNAGKPLHTRELAILFFTAFFAVLLCGPGKISVDAMISK